MDIRWQYYKLMIIGLFPILSDATFPPKFSPGFKTWNIPRVAQKEVLKIFRNSIVTLMFSSFVFIVLGADYFLAETVVYMKEEQPFDSTLQDLNTTLKKVNTLFIGWGGASPSPWDFGQ